MKKWFKGLPVHVILVGLCLIWLLPTFGLLVTSFRPVQDVNETGWWTVLSPPKGHQEYQDLCAACHGEDGKGMAGSAPDLSVYGDAKFVVNVLGMGKKGMIGNMPKFNDGRLTNVQKTAVGTYVSSLAK